MSEPLPAELQVGLERSATRRGRFGEPVVFFTETTSTNDMAAALAEAGAPDGALVLAAAQTCGRGRLGRHWSSPSGAGLYASVVIRQVSAAPLLTLAAGVAVADGVRSATGLSVCIKWPNDIIVPDEVMPGRRRKLAGVLAEGSAGARGLHYVVLGFGLNLRPAPYPPEVAARATSLEAELGRHVDAGAVLGEILSGLNEQVTRLAAGQHALTLQRWRALAPSANGARVEWTVHFRPLRGITAGIDDDGALRVRTEGRIERIVAGEVTWL